MLRYNTLTMWDWIVQNKQWVFSGVGIAILGALWWFINKFWPRRETPQAPAPVLTTQAPTTTIAPVITMNPTIHIPMQSPAPEAPKPIPEVAVSVHTVESLGAIRFDYLPILPTERGWTKVYKEDGTAKFGTDHDIDDSLRMEVTQSEFAMDCTVPVHATLANRLIYTAKYNDSGGIGALTMVFAYVEVSTKSGEPRKRLWIKFYFGDNRAFPTPGVWHDLNKELPEHTVHWPAVPLRNGQLKFDIDLHEAVRLAVGAQGWIYKGIYKVRLRGNLSISPIEFAN
jgi:hypothetical protein